jgi:hypothetical protein
MIFWWGIWTAINDSAVAGRTGSKTGSAAPTGNTTPKNTQSDTADRFPEPSPPSPTDPTRPTEPAKVSNKPLSPPPESKGDTSKIGSPIEPISAKSDQDADKPSILGGSFFGIRAQGQRFVYVVDCSGSMEGPPYERAAKELIRSLAALSRSQEFFVILYSDDSYPMFYPGSTQKFVKATDDAIEQVQSWVLSFRYRGGTNPDPALQLALKVKPDAVFFLTDGAIPDSTANLVYQANTDEVPVHTVCFTNRAGQATLERIAKENQGKYLFVP